MRRAVSEKVLHRLVRELAKKTRKEIDDSGLAIEDFEGIAHKYGIKLQWQEMSLDQDGHYLKGAKIITLNSRITHPERRNFSFCHEFIHDRIDRNDDLYEIIHESAAHVSDESYMDRLIERLCNIGAAEVLIPSDELRSIIEEQGFSTALIPELCERFNASSIAVAIKMVSSALHGCYFFIAEKRQMASNRHQPNLLFVKSKRNWQLWVAYSGGSPTAKYPMARNIPIPSGHLMYRALDAEGDVICGEDDIPRHNSGKRPWVVDCDCLAFKGWVFAFFHVAQPVSPNQLKLFDM